MSNNKYLSANDFVRSVYNCLARYKYLIAACGIAGAVFFGIYASFSPPYYTSKAVIFSLSSSNDNPSASSALSMILGGDAGKSFTDETSVNIVEVAQSRAINEAVAAITVPAMQNKMIAALLIDSMNAHKGLFQKIVKPPVTKNGLIVLAGLYLKASVSASINKNNSFVLTYTGTSPELVRAISYAYIEQISNFYVDLKRGKAKRDYEFASNKADSLKRVMGSKDFAMISLDKRTLFTNTDKLEYRVPSENLQEDKQMIRSQYSQAVINQQTAAYKLQKDTPMIQVLDKPDPPYDVAAKSVVLYAIIGLFLGCLGAACLVVTKLFFRFSRQEIARAVFSSLPAAPANVSSTANVSGLSE